MDDLSRFCCLNSRCPDFGRRDAGNLTVTGRLGKSRQFRLLYCRTCRARFSERKGTPLYRAHLAEDKVTSILEHIHEGCGVLKTARLVKVHPDTVSRYSRTAGEHARAAHDELVAHSPETYEGNSCHARLIHILDRTGCGAERTLRQRCRHEFIEVAVQHA